MNETKPDHYFHGDACAYTGKTQKIAQGVFYVYKLIEGHRKGEIIYSQKPPLSHTLNHVRDVTKKVSL